MSIESGTIAAKLVGVHETKTALSGVLEDWGENVPSTFRAYPTAFNNIFTNLDDKIDALSGEFVERMDGESFHAASGASTSATAAYDCAVEYLQTDGTAYIDTGIIGTNELKVEMKFDEDKSNAHIDATSFVFGARTDASSGIFLLMYRPSNSSSTPKGVMTLGYNTSTSTISPTNQPSTNPFVAKTGLVFKTFLYRHLTLNGEQWSTSVVDFSNGLNNYLFAINNGGTGLVSTSATGYQRIYYCKIWKNDVLVRDYIPVRKNGVGYMFDRVSKTLFGNVAGSGAFSYGNDAEDSTLETAVAIGKDAVATENALQLGNGTNEQPKNFYIGNALLLDQNGNIQKDSLDPDFLLNLNLKFALCNTNFQGLSSFLTSAESANASVGSRASGWSFSTDGTNWNNKVRIFHWGHFGFVMGSAKCSSALTANTKYSNVGTIAWPSGITNLAACEGTRDTDIIMVVAGGGAITIRCFVAKSANTSMAIGTLFYIGSPGNKWTQRNVSTL